MKFPKKIGQDETKFFENQRGKSKEGDIQKSEGDEISFYFHFFLLTIIITDTTFRSGLQGLTNCAQSDELFACTKLRARKSNKTPLSYYIEFIFVSESKYYSAQ